MIETINRVPNNQVLPSSSSLSFSQICNANVGDKSLNNQLQKLSKKDLSQKDIQKDIIRDVGTLISDLIKGVVEGYFEVKGDTKPATQTVTPETSIDTSVSGNSASTPGSAGTDIQSDLTASPSSANSSASNIESVKKYLLDHLKPDSKGQFNEEQMQHGVVMYLLSQRSLELSQKYSDYIDRYMKHDRASYEDGVKAALAGFVSKGSISKSDADKFASISFSAAQLDGDVKHLYDSIGGGDDKTIATMKASEAVNKVAKKLLTLISPSTGTSLEVNGSNLPPANQISSPGFLWKPISESDRKLVVLLPQSISKNILSVSLYKALPPNATNKLEEGVFAGIGNGDRAHYRFKKQGRSYPDGLYVVARLNNGRTFTQQISDVSRKLEK